jgi:hypothetical protein
MAMNLDQVEDGRLGRLGRPSRKAAKEYSPRRKPWVKR